MSPDISTYQAQRLWPRWFVAGAKPVKVDLGPAGSGPLVDIGGGGFRVQSLAPLRRGAEVPVRIELPERTDPLQCSGVVVWSKPNGAAGIRFANLNDTQRTLLQGWLGDLERAATNPAQATVQDDFTNVVSQIRGAQLNNADALNLIVRRAKELSSVAGASVSLGNPDNMVCVAAAGEGPAVGTVVPAVVGLAGECIFKRKMVHCEDSKNDPRVGRDAWFGSAVILPLLVKGEVRGVLQVFSKRSYAFTTSMIDSLEKLSDAVVFVTHGIVTQRRLATAKPSLSNASTTLGPKPNPPLSPLTAGFTTPVAGTPSSSASQINFSAPVFTKPALAVETVPIASSIATPGASALKPKALEWEDRSVPLAAPNVTPRWQEAPGGKHSSAGKWIGLAVGVAVLTAVPGWYAVKHHESQPIPVTAAEASTVSVPSPSSVVQLKSEPVTVAAPAVSVPVPVPAVSSTNTSSAHVATPKHEEKSVATHAPEHQAAVEPPAGQAPIVLASNTPKTARPMDLDAVVPVKLPAIPANAAVSQIALPAANKATPDLAPQVKTEGYLVKKVNPVYPQMARAAGIQGPVELQLHVTPEGKVDSVQRVSGQPMLANAAIDAVKQWRYEPAKINGRPVEMQTKIRLNFALNH